MKDYRLEEATKKMARPFAVGFRYRLPWQALSYSLFGLTLIMMLSTFLDYGVTWDENWHLTYGEHIVQWYLTGFQDRAALSYWTLPLQGGFTGVVAQLAVRLSPIGGFETAHLTIALFGLLGTVIVYKLGNFLGGRPAGFLSAVFLILTPRFYGHSFNNLTDIPFATLSVLSLYLLIRLVQLLPNPPLGHLAKLGAAMGLALAVRPGGILLVGYLGLALAIWAGYSFLMDPGDRPQGQSDRSTLFRLAISFSLVCTIAYLVMLLFWPAAQMRPLIQPAKGLLYATQFQYPFEVFFEGHYVSNQDLPWYFLPKWFLISLPEHYFIAFAAALVLAGLSLKRRSQDLHSVDPAKWLGVLVLLVAVVLPIVYTSILRPPNYDGVRHYLFLVPPLAILSALSILRLMARNASRLVRAAIILALVASFALTLIDMVRLHPHQYVYFNRIFAKGLVGAAQSYETDYWGNSYKEGAEWLLREYPGLRGLGRTKVASCSYSLSTSYFLPADKFEYLGSFHDGQPIPDEARPDLLLATTRWDCHKTLPGRVVHTVSRMGVPLLFVIEVTQSSS